MLLGWTVIGLVMLAFIAHSVWQDMRAGNIDNGPLLLTLAAVVGLRVIWDVLGVWHRTQVQLSERERMKRDIGLSNKDEDKE